MNLVVQMANVANNYFGSLLENPDLILVRTNDQFPVQRVNIGPDPFPLFVLDGVLQRQVLRPRVSQIRPQQSAR